MGTGSSSALRTTWFFSKENLDSFPKLLGEISEHNLRYKEVIQNQVDEYLNDPINEEKLARYRELGQVPPERPSPTQFQMEAKEKLTEYLLHYPFELTKRKLIQQYIDNGYCSPSGCLFLPLSEYTIRHLSRQHDDNNFWSYDLRGSHAVAKLYLNVCSAVFQCKTGISLESSVYVSIFVGPTKQQIIDWNKELAALVAKPTVYSELPTEPPTEPPTVPTTEPSAAVVQQLNI